MPIMLLPPQIILSASPAFARGYGRLRVSLELGPSRRSESVELFLDGIPSGRLRVEAPRRTAELMVPLRAGIQRYRLSGESVATDGRRQAVTGQGVLLDCRSLEKRLRRAKRGETGTELFALLSEIDAALSRPRGTLRVSHGRAVSQADLQAAEERLKTRLPEAYKTLLAELGAFEVRVAAHLGHEDPDDTDQRLNALIVGLRHPAELRTVDSWLASELRADPTGLSERERALLPRLQKDVVLAASLSSHWVFGTVDGILSVETLTPDFFDEESGLFNAYLGGPRTPFRDFLRRFPEHVVSVLFQLAKDPSIVLVHDETGAALVRKGEGSSGVDGPGDRQHLVFVLRGPAF